MIVSDFKSLGDSVRHAQLRGLAKLLYAVVHRTQVGVGEFLYVKGVDNHDVAHKDILKLSVQMAGVKHLVELETMPLSIEFKTDARQVFLHRGVVADDDKLVALNHIAIDNTRRAGNLLLGEQRDEDNGAVAVIAQPHAV